MKTTMLAVLFATIATVAVAQAPAPPAPAPAPKVTLEFDPQQLQLLGEAISNLPKKLADPFLIDLQRQVDEQKKAAAQKAEADKKAKK